MHSASAHTIQPQGFLGSLFQTVGTLFFALLFAFLFLVVSEWVGMTFFWPGERVTHAKQLLVKELEYLHQDFQKTLVAEDSVHFAKGFADKMYYLLFKATGIDSLIKRSKQPVGAHEKGTRRLIHNIYHASEDYILSAVYTTQTYAVRMAVLVMAMPLFAIFMVMGLTEGLVRRDLRRWKGGRESSLVYAYAKNGVMPAFSLAWVVYLSLPVSWHPNWVILPFGILCGLAIGIMVGSFKKYL